MQYGSGFFANNYSSRFFSAIGMEEGIFSSQGQ
jgi:hypothetical protein